MSQYWSEDGSWRTRARMLWSPGMDIVSAEEIVFVVI